MNASVGENAPEWLCLESRNFRTDERKGDEEEGAYQTVRHFGEWFVAKDICEEYGLSYSAFKHAYDRGKVTGKLMNKHRCVQRKELERYIRLPRKRGKPKD